MFQFIQMTRFLFKNVLKSRHLVSDQSSRLFGFQIVNLPFIIFDLLVNILQLFFDGISRRFSRNKFMLFFGGNIFIFLLIKHLIDFDDLVFQLAVSFLQLLDVFSPKWVKRYLISSDNFYFYLILWRLEWGVSKKSLPLYL